MRTRGDWGNRAAGSLPRPGRRASSVLPQMSPSHGEVLCPSLSFFSTWHSYASITLRFFKETVLQQLFFSSHTHSKYNTKIFPHLAVSVKSFVPNPQSQGPSLLLSSAVSGNSSRFREEQLGEEVQDPLPQVPLVADPAQLQGTLRRHLPLCKGTSAAVSHPHHQPTRIYI